MDAISQTMQDCVTENRIHQTNITALSMQKYTMKVTKSIVSITKDHKYKKK